MVGELIVAGSAGGGVVCLCGGLCGLPDRLDSPGWREELLSSHVIDDAVCLVTTTTIEIVLQTERDILLAAIYTTLTILLFTTRNWRLQRREGQRLRRRERTIETDRVATAEEAEV